MPGDCCGRTNWFPRARAILLWRTDARKLPSFIFSFYIDCRSTERDPTHQVLQDHLRQQWPHWICPGLRHGPPGSRHVRHSITVLIMLIDWSIYMRLLLAVIVIPSRGGQFACGLHIGVLVQSGERLMVFHSQPVSMFWYVWRHRKCRTTPCSLLRILMENVPPVCVCPCAFLRMTDFFSCIFGLSPIGIGRA